MNYFQLDSEYWNTQINRVEVLRAKIHAKTFVGDGRVVPEDDSLAIGDGRRLSMAVMFIDICNFSTRPSETQTEQEMMLRVLNLFFTELIRIAEDYSGNVEKNTGDGLMIYFKDDEGTPATNGAIRAVTCALTMLKATDELINPILIKSRVDPIDFRISIDHGFVTVARIGAPRRFNSYTAIGTTANFASKFMRRAGPNEIVIGEAVRKLLPDSWQFNFTESSTEPTGWNYRSTGETYPLFYYTGRWLPF